VIRHLLYLNLLKTSHTEVQSVIEDGVDALNSKHPDLHEWRLNVINKVVEALEADISWLEVYGLSGELNIPGNFENVEEELRGPLQELQEVGSFVATPPGVNHVSGPKSPQAYVSTPRHLARNQDTGRRAYHECELRSPFPWTCLNFPRDCRGRRHSINISCRCCLRRSACCSGSYHSHLLPLGRLENAAQGSAVYHAIRPRGDGQGLAGEWEEARRFHSKGNILKRAWFPPIR
jgi:hypothetical protein